MRRDKVGLAAVLSSLVLAAPAAAEGLPSCAPPVEVSNVRVTRVEVDGVLVLEDGRAVKVEGLLLPGGTRDHAPQFLADESIKALSDLTVGGIVTLAARKPKEDRYGRLRAQVVIDNQPDGGWLQEIMLQRGLARVSIAPDRRECAEALYAAESAARSARRGIWAQSSYAVRSPIAALKADTDTFQIVKGTILSAAVKNGRGYLDFGSDWSRDFSATISPEDMKSFRQAGIDPESYAGKTVRVRGWVERLRRPEIEIAVPEDIEVLDGQ